MNPPTNPAPPPGNDEPPVREFADRGTLWLLESPENLRGLLRLVAADIADRLDFSRAERINRSFVPDDLHKQEADLLYRVPFHEGSAGEVLVYVLLEHQSRPDRTMSLRLLSYMVQLWETQRRGWRDAKTPVSQWRLLPVIPVVFYTGRRRWSAASLGLETLMDFPAPLARFVPRHDTLFLSLRDTPPDALTGSALAHVLRVLRSAADAPAEELASLLTEAITYLETLPPAAQAEWRRAVYYLYLLVRHTPAGAEQDTLFQRMNEALEPHHQEEVQQIAMTGAQELIARGRREGRREGRQEGQREVVRALLESRFGPLDAATAANVDALTPAQVNEVVRRFANAQTLADLGL